MKNDRKIDEGKTVNLFEDMNFHEHDDKSFKKMKSLVKKDKSSKYSTFKNYQEMAEDDDK